jgi:hypothetical protein
MKLPSLLILASTTCALAADSPYEREFKQLTDQRDSAAAAAVAPINRRYQAALEQLLKRATQNGDLDAAVKIRAALSSIPAAASATEQVASLPSLLMSGTWEWYSNSEFTGKSYRVTFGDNKQCSVEPGVQFLTKWEAINPKQVRIHLKNGNYYVFDLDLAKKQGVNNPDEATQKEAKSMRLEAK